MVDRVADLRPMVDRIAHRAQVVGIFFLKASFPVRDKSISPIVSNISSQKEHQVHP